MNKVKKISVVFGVASIMTLNVALATTGKIATESIRIREEATTDSETIEYGSLNEEVEIIGEEGNWYKINFKGKQGYIYSKYVTVEEDETTETETTETTTEEQSAGTTSQTEEASETNDTQTTITPVIGNTITQATQMRILPNINSTVLANVEQGNTVTLNQTIGNWTKVTIKNIEGWVPNVALISTQTTVEEQTEETTEEQSSEETEGQAEDQTETTENVINQAGYISSNASAHLRAGPGTENESLGKLPRHTVVTVISEENGWYKVDYNGTEGYISSELVTLGEVPEEEETTSSRSAEETRTATTSTTATGDIVSTAQSYLGYNYVYGGKSPSTGFDCSGFTQYVYSQCGISLSGTAASQTTQGTEVDKSNLQAGDLVYFTYYGGSSIQHVGIYVGNGQFIHAANSSRGVVYDTIESGYYSTNYAGARRF